MRSRCFRTPLLRITSVDASTQKRQLTERIALPSPLTSACSPSVTEFSNLRNWWVIDSVGRRLGYTPPIPILNAPISFGEDFEGNANAKTAGA